MVFRDVKTLETSSDHIRANFPNGADILIYGCSTGEENISEKALLPEAKYRVIGYDCSADTLRIGKRGVYSLFSDWHDSYLIPNVNYPLAESVLFNHSKEECDKMNELRRKFHEIMREIPAQREFQDINNKYGYKSLKYERDDFIEKFYVLRDAYKEQIDLRLGNFLNVGKVRKERPVGGIFFRNAIYHLCDNNLNEVLEFNEPVKVSRNIGLLMENLVNGVHSTLDENGIFVLGNHIKEHLYLADESLPESKTINFCETPFFNERNFHHRKYRFLKCYKESPLIKALLKKGKFEPIGFSKVTTYGCSVEVPVIFKKIKL